MVALVVNHLHRKILARKDVFDPEGLTSLEVGSPRSCARLQPDGAEADQRQNQRQY